MKKYISILFIFLYSFALAQDVYPNFSSPKKQFKFEKQRIYIEEIEENEIIIEAGGYGPDYFQDGHEDKGSLVGSLVGSLKSKEFSKYLIDGTIPDYLTQPTSPFDIYTRCAYRYSFEITQNNKQLNEVNLLYLADLEDEADDIIKAHERQLKDFINEYSKKSYGPVYGPLMLASVCFLAKIAQNAATATTMNDNHFDNPDEAIFIGSFSLIYGAYKWFTISSYNSKISNTPSIPILQQTMSLKELTALAETYNKELYKEIQFQP